MGSGLSISSIQTLEPVLFYKNHFTSHRPEDSLLEDAGLSEKYLHGFAVVTVLVCDEMDKKT